MNLRWWALEVNGEVRYEKFKAGHWLMCHFKKGHNIVLQKITKLVTRSSRSVTEHSSLVSENDDAAIPASARVGS